MRRTVLQGLAVVALVVAITLSTQSAYADPSGDDRAGDRREISLDQRTETRGDRSSGSSSSRYTLVERVIAVREDGLELEFDLPDGTDDNDRARNWQFPARVFRSEPGGLTLMNAAELESRLRAWLEMAEIPDTACGSWIFTWTAIKIECDPQSVLEVLQAFDIRPSDATVSAVQIDPDALRRERAEMDVLVAQMLGEPSLSLETALQNRASEQLSGTTTTRFELDEYGRMARRVTVGELEIVLADGARERTVTTTTVESRRLASQ